MRILVPNAKPAPATPEPPVTFHPHHAGANLTTGSTDDEMLTALQGDDALLGRVQAAARMAYEAARMLRGGPVQAVDHRWQQATSASGDALLAAGGRNVIGTRNAADWKARVKMLRVAMQVGDHFRDLVSRWETMPPGEREAVTRQSQSEAGLRAFNVMPPGVQMAPPAYNAQPLLADLAQRGVHLWASEGGTILARPGRALTPRDRETITMHKAAIVAALGDEVAVA